MFKCINDLYDADSSTHYDSVEDFLHMCHAAFGEAPRLVEFHDGWRNEYGNAVLVEVADEATPTTPLPPTAEQQRAMRMLYDAAHGERIDATIDGYGVELAGAYLLPRTCEYLVWASKDDAHRAVGYARHDVARGRDLNVDVADEDAYQAVQS